MLTLQPDLPCITEYSLWSNVLFRGWQRQLSLLLNSMSNPWYIMNTFEHLQTENKFCKKEIFALLVLLQCVLMISEAITRMKSSCDKTAFHLVLI